VTAVNDVDAAKYYNKQPKKRVGAGVLFFNGRSEVLIVKPIYLEKWLWVGGSADEGEAPKATALRECQEEIGITPASLWLAFVNYLPSQPTGQSDILQFLFTSAPINDDFIGKLKLQESEIEDARFVPVDELAKYMHEYRARAIQTYWKHKQGASTLYLEDGSLV
jgi:8-oxo-dGTP pyrophosphatase MutT (NUDIX family)